MVNQEVNKPDIWETWPHKTIMENIKTFSLTNFKKTAKTNQDLVTEKLLSYTNLHSKSFAAKEYWIVNEQISSDNVMTYCEADFVLLLVSFFSTPQSCHYH